MTLADKSKYILYYQYLYSQWLEKFNKGLELGTVASECIDKSFIISSLISVLYRFKSDEETIPECISEEDFCIIISKLKSIFKAYC